MSNATRTGPGAGDILSVRIQPIDEQRFPVPRQIARIDAFASRLEAYVIADHEALNAELLAVIGQWRQSDPGVRATNRNGWQSSRNVFHREEPCFQILQAHIMAGLTQSVRGYWPGYDPARHLATCEAWVNVNDFGGFNTPHDHGGNHLSACYYVAVPKVGNGPNESAIEFMNPAGGLTGIQAFGQAMISPSARIEPTAGQLIVFPSYLKHWVYPNPSTEERVSIAINLIVREDRLEPVARR